MKLEGIDLGRRILTEPGRVVLHAEIHRLLGLDQFAHASVREEGAKLVLARSLDHEISIELLMSDLDVLHAEPLGDLGEHAGAADREAESIGIHIWCAHSREHHRGLARRHGVAVERDLPLAVRCLHRGALEKAAVHETRVRFATQLTPHFVAAGAEPLPHQSTSILHACLVRRVVRHVMPCITQRSKLRRKSGTEKQRPGIMMPGRRCRAQYYGACVAQYRG